MQYDFDKASGFEVMDNINIYVSGNAKVVAIAEKNAAEIMGETLGKSLTNVIKIKPVLFFSYS
mgnify:CR=1 FL=1